MKRFTKLWAVAFLALAFANYSQAQEPELLTPKVKNWWTDFSISPYGAMKHADIAGKPIWGGGLELGYQINRTVRLSVGNTIFDRPETKHDEGGWFSGSAIDETEVLFRADLIKGGGAGKDRFVGFLIGGGSRDWESEDWGFGVGAGAELRLSRNFSLGADSRLRAWFNQDKDVITRGFLSVRF